METSKRRLASRRHWENRTHLAALTARLQNVAARIDEDETEAIEALQQPTLSPEANSEEQVNKALAGMGSIWTSVQEDETFRLAAAYEP